MVNGLPIYMMVTKDARQDNEVNRAFSIGKQHTDCPTVSSNMMLLFIPVRPGSVAWCAC